MLGEIGRVLGIPAESFDPEQATIEDFVRDASSMTPPGAKLLDAGAGDAPYRKYFSHTDYVAVDDASTPYHAFGSVDVVCDLTQLPMASELFDTILCTQVLEHVPNPQLVLAEFVRVLKPGGRLFLTVPQSWEIHEAPRDYFRFTRYGLEMILRGAGFEELSIVPRGGYFYFLAERVRHLPRYVKRERLWAIPLAHKTLTVLCTRVLPRVLAAMDKRDTLKRETLGYGCIAVKPKI